MLINNLVLLITIIIVFLVIFYVFYYDMNKADKIIILFLTLILS